MTVTEEPKVYRPWDKLEIEKIGKYEVVLLDIDGVLADTRHRDHHVQASPKRWGPYFAAMRTDAYWQPGLDLYTELMDSTAEIVYLTGRNENYRHITLDWLLDGGYGLQWELIMRPIHNHRPLAQFKSDIVAEFTDGAHPEKVLMIDDDPRVIEAVRKTGAAAWQTPWQTKVRSLVNTPIT